MQMFFLAILDLCSKFHYISNAV